MAGNASTQKICLICKQDCAGKPRVRDNEGRYYCKSCLANKKQEQERNGAIAIEKTEMPAMKTCSVCIRPMAPGTVVCMNCGHDTRKGIQTSSLVQKTRTKKGERELKCPNCGYDMTGAPGLTCPECGHRVDIARPDRHIKSARNDTVRDAYRKPILMILIGLVGVSLFMSMFGQGDDLPTYFLFYAISVPIGILGFFLCCMIWLGFDAPWHLTALNLAAVYAVTDLVQACAGLIPIPLVPLLISLLCYMGLLSSMLDLEWEDTWLVAVVTFLIKAGVILGMGAFIFSQS